MDCLLCEKSVSKSSHRPCSRYHDGKHEAFWIDFKRQQADRLQEKSSAGGESRGVVASCVLCVA
jgi:hypothetical protein